MTSNRIGSPYSPFWLSFVLTYGTLADEEMNNSKPASVRRLVQYCNVRVSVSCTVCLWIGPVVRHRGVLGPGLWPLGLDMVLQMPADRLCVMNYRSKQTLEADH